MTAARSAYARAVSAWAEHLRCGGTTPWSVWRSRSHSDDVALLDPTPDALHLELVRRLNERGAPDGGLADVVLAASAPGRGMVDVPLPWSGDGAPRFGPPPVDPADLPADELVRMAVGVLVTLLPGVPVAEAATPPARWPLPGRRRFAVHGTPGTAEALRDAAVALGAVESGWRPVHLVVALPVEAMMAELWAARTREGDILRWETFWRKTIAAGGLPAALDAAGTATRWGAAGRDVHVVVAEDAPEAVRLGIEVLGLRAEGVAVPAAMSPDPHAIDLLRQLNRILPLTVGADLVVPLGRVLLERVLPGSGEGVPTPAPPDTALTWAGRQGRTAAGRLRSAGRHAGYAVHGDPDALAHSAGGSGALDDDRTLGLALTACLRAWQLQGGRPGMARA